jgi:DnaJ-class molecular chaperone
MTMHPDKGGDAEDFKKLVEAYETLSDDSKRKVYDRFGKQGAKIPGFEVNGEGIDPFRDIFRGFSGFGFQMPTVYNVELTLEDIYSGREILVKLGKGQVTVRVTPGMLEGTELGAEIAGRQVIFVLQQRTHHVFQRKRHDLLMSIKVPLIDALLGFERKVGLLNGSDIWIASPPGRTTGHDDVFVLEGLGMPIPDDPMHSHGDLYVRIEVVMPQQLQLSSEDRAVLQRIFNKSSTTTGKSSASTSSTAPDKSSSKRQQTMKSTNIRNFGRRLGVFGTQQQYSRFRSSREDDDDGSGFSSFSSFFR